MQSFVTHQVPQSAKDAIHRVRQKGIKVFICTGRPIPFINRLADVEYDGLVACNGAISITTDGTVISKHIIPHADIVRVVEDARQHAMPIAVADDKIAVTVNHEAAPKEIDYIFDLLDIELPAPQPINVIKSMDVLQLVAFFTPEQEERMMNEVLTGCQTNRWHDYFADVVAAGTHKAVGVDDVCRYYGIDIKDTVAFGDGGNDITMLEHVGTGVAMGNAPDDVKAHADMVTAHVDDDGVAKALAALVP